MLLFSLVFCYFFLIYLGVSVSVFILGFVGIPTAKHGWLHNSGKFSLFIIWILPLFHSLWYFSLELQLGMWWTFSFRSLYLSASIPCFLPLCPSVLNNVFKCAFHLIYSVSQMLFNLYIEIFPFSFFYLSSLLVLVHYFLSIYLFGRISS